LVAGPFLRNETYRVGVPELQTGKVIAVKRASAVRSGYHARVLKRRIAIFAL